MRRTYETDAVLAFRVERASRIAMYPVQVVAIAVVCLFFSALLLALVLWLLA